MLKLPKINYKRCLKDAVNGKSYAKSTVLPVAVVCRGELFQYQSELSAIVRDSVTAKKSGKLDKIMEDSKARFIQSHYPELNKLNVVDRYKNIHVTTEDILTIGDVVVSTNNKFMVAVYLQEYDDNNRRWLCYKGPMKFTRDCKVALVTSQSKGAQEFANNILDELKDEFGFKIGEYFDIEENLKDKKTEHYTILVPYTEMNKYGKEYFIAVTIQRMK
ncbi:MAG: hypothetical protein ACRC92_26790 [Peptostreptococcaceae bacterium]